MSELFKAVGEMDAGAQQGMVCLGIVIGVLEGLAGLRRQACAIVFREIHEGYVMPVGVWEVRENVRKAMQSSPKKFNTLKEALEDIRSRLINPLESYIQQSEILRQRRLTDYV